MRTKLLLPQHNPELRSRPAARRPRTRHPARRRAGPSPVGVSRERAKTLRVQRNPPPREPPRKQWYSNETASTSPRTPARAAPARPPQAPPTRKPPHPSRNPAANQRTAASHNPTPVDHKAPPPAAPQASRASRASRDEFNTRSPRARCHRPPPARPVRRQPMRPAQAPRPCEIPYSPMQLPAPPEPTPTLEHQHPSPRKTPIPQPTRVPRAIVNRALPAPVRQAAQHRPALPGPALEPHRQELRAAAPQRVRLETSRVQAASAHRIRRSRASSLPVVRRALPEIADQVPRHRRIRSAPAPGAEHRELRPAPVPLPQDQATPENSRAQPIPVVPARAHRVLHHSEHQPTRCLRGVLDRTRQAAQHRRVLPGPALEHPRAELRAAVPRQVRLKASRMQAVPAHRIRRSRASSLPVVRRALPEIAGQVEAHRRIPRGPVRGRLGPQPVPARVHPVASRRCPTAAGRAGARRRVPRGPVRGQGLPGWRPVLARVLQVGSRIRATTVDRAGARGGPAGLKPERLAASRVQPVPNRRAELHADRCRHRPVSAEPRRADRARSSAVGRMWVRGNLIRRPQPLAVPVPELSPRPPGLPERVPGPTPTRPYRALPFHRGLETSPTQPVLPDREPRRQRRPPRAVQRPKVVPGQWLPPDRMPIRLCRERPDGRVRRPVPGQLGRRRPLRAVRRPKVVPG